MNKVSSLKYSLKNIAKKAVYDFLGNSFLIKYRIKTLNYKNKLTILNFHRVAEDDLSCYSPLNPKVFKEFICFLKKNYHITSFSEFRKNTAKINKPKVIISFDDGYKDFISVVHPILMEEGIRANQNIIPSCVDTGKPPLNVAINDFLGKTNNTEWRSLEIPGYCWNDNLNVFQESLRLSSYIKNQTKDIQNKIESKIYEQIGERLNELSTKMMNKNDIFEILNFYDWGAHSYNHANMGIESNEFFIADLKNCKKWFINNFNFEPAIYAFPNGSYRKDQIEIAKKNGFNEILLVNDDFSKVESYAHPRFGFRADSYNEMKVMTTGILRKFFID